MSGDDFGRLIYLVLLGCVGFALAAKYLEVFPKTPAGADATFSGLTRGVGDTVAEAHPPDVSVADALGAAIASMELQEGEDSILGWDVAPQRMRALLRVPFRVDYVSP